MERWRRVHQRTINAGGASIREPSSCPRTVKFDLTPLYTRTHPFDGIAVAEAAMR